MASITAQPPVLVVGAGPTGLALAIEMKRHGLGCRVIDAASGPAVESRALGIQPRTLEMFATMGVIDEFLARGKRIKGGYIHSAGEVIAHIPFDALETEYPFVLSIPQSETEAILGGHVSVERRTTLTSFTQDAAGVTAVLRHADGSDEEARFSWIAGCDGAHSVTRKSAGIAFEGGEFPETFLLADVYVGWDLPDDEFHIFLHPDGLFGAFGFGGGRYRLIAGNPPASTSDLPTLAEIQAVAAVRGPQRMVVDDPRWTARFRIHHRVVSCFRSNRVFLLGDAAHIHSPAGGQGMNTGIQDACNLAWKLALVESGAAGTDLLDSFDAERRPVAQAVLKGTTMLTDVISSHSRTVQYLRDRLAPLVSSLAHRAIARNVAQLAVNYRHSAIVEDHRGGGDGPHAGDRWPHFPPGTAHTLLAPRGLALRERLAQYAPYLTVVEMPEENGAIHLIRPDGYVAFRGGADDLVRYLARLFPHAKL